MGGPAGCDGKERSYGMYLRYVPKVGKVCKAPPNADHRAREFTSLAGWLAPSGSDQHPRWRIAMAIIHTLPTYRHVIARTLGSRYDMYLPTVPQVGTYFRHAHAVMHVPWRGC